MKNDPNIILHLKCSVKDLEIFQNNVLTSTNYNPDIEQIKSFDNTDSSPFGNIFTSCGIIENKQKQPSEKSILVLPENDKKIKEKNLSKKKINDKLKLLSQQLRGNNISGKKSDCFWCTYYFDNPPIYIPARQRGDDIEVYGCFCSPQCAVAYLSDQNIDSTTYWERYSLLNNIYGKIYGENNIKPAPNPYYILEKYYGNLSIQEYRQMLGNSQILMVIDKPLTKIFPELHEENFETPPIFLSMHQKNKMPSVNKLRLKRDIPHTSKLAVFNQNFNFS